MYISLALQNATRLEDVVEMINSGGTCEGVEGIEFNAWQLAGQYAWDAAKDAGYTDPGSLDGQLEYLENVGAEFDRASALAHANALMNTSEPARFTVILLYPESMNATGSETYTWVGCAPSAEDALCHAREAARTDNGLNPEDGPVFPTIAVIDGHPQFLEV